MKVSKQLYALINYYKYLKSISINNFDERQKLKSDFVASFNLDDNKAYYDFKYKMERLERDKHDIDECVIHLERYLKDTFKVDIFELLYCGESLQVVDSDDSSD